VTIAMQQLGKQTSKIETVFYAVRAKPIWSQLRWLTDRQSQCDFDLTLTVQFWSECSDIQSS
jgi:hypothetical protein